MYYVKIENVPHHESPLAKANVPHVQVGFKSAFTAMSNSELKIYDAADSTTRLQEKEIYHARQKLWIICGPRSILNGFVILNTT